MTQIPILHYSQFTAQVRLEGNSGDCPVYLPPPVQSRMAGFQSCLLYLNECSVANLLTTTPSCHIQHCIDLQHRKGNSGIQSSQGRYYPFWRNPDFKRRHMVQNGFISSLLILSKRAFNFKNCKRNMQKGRQMENVAKELHPFFSKYALRGFLLLLVKLLGRYRTSALYRRTFYQLQCIIYKCHRL